MFYVLNGSTVGSFSMATGETLVELGAGLVTGPGLLFVDEAHLFFVASGTLQEGDVFVDFECDLLVVLEVVGFGRFAGLGPGLFEFLPLK